MNQLFEGATGFMFDCDGTLLDTMAAWNDLEESLFAQATIPFTPEELDEARALPVQLSAGKFFEHGIGTSPQDVLDMLDNALLDYYRNEACPLPGAVEFVRSAHAAGIPCTVVSSSPQRYVQAGMARAGIAECFTKIVTTEDVDMSKQDPRIYLHTVKAMGSDPATTWGFDDALYALQAMREAGIRTCGCHDYDVTGTFEQLSEAADMAIHSFEELL